MTTLDIEAMATVCGGKNQPVNKMKAVPFTATGGDGTVYDVLCVEDSKVEISSPQGEKFMGMSCGFKARPKS